MLQVDRGLRRMEVGVDASRKSRMIPNPKRGATIMAIGYFASIVAPSMASTSLNACAVTGSRAERRRR